MVYLLLVCLLLAFIINYSATHNCYLNPIMYCIENYSCVLLKTRFNVISLLDNLFYYIHLAKAHKGVKKILSAFQLVR